MAPPSKRRKVTPAQGSAGAGRQDPPTPQDTFGNLSDGYNVRHDDPEDVVLLAQRQYMARRNLAELDRMPEGYRAPYVDSTGYVHFFTLLTPPDMVAVQHEDGSWSRTIRTADSQSPPPYSDDWYSEYLQAHGLPNWFFRPGHLTMLYDRAEARLLGMSEPTSPLPAPRNYLERRFSIPQAYLVDNAFGASHHRLLVNLTPEFRSRFVRRFPALDVDRVTALIIYLSSGHLQLRLEHETNLPSADINDIETVAETDGPLLTNGPQRASYRIQATALEYQDHTLSAPLASETTAGVSRDDMIIGHFDDGHLVNPSRQVLGLGTWGYLEPADEQLASDMGYASIDEINLARQQGALPIGTGRNAGPAVVFRPEEQFFNPPVQPDMAGAWRFLVEVSDSYGDSDADFAAMNFGGSYGLPARPTAAEIFRLRQQFISEGDIDITSGINLVWVPGEVEEPGQSTQPEQPEQDVAPVVPPGLSLSDDITSHSQVPLPSSSHTRDRTLNTNPQTPPPNLLASNSHSDPNFDPTNNDPGGSHDQTGGYRAEYVTFYDKGNWQTIDTSRAHPREPEPHKLMYWSSSKGFTRWRYADKVDWHDEETIRKLNRAREQSHKRSKMFPPKRAEPRPDYTTEQRQWMMDRVIEAGGDRGTLDPKEIAQAFREQFPNAAPRTDGGIQSFIDRMRIEFEQFGGLKPRFGRGHMQNAAAKRMAGAGVGEGKGKGKARDVEEDEDYNEGDDDEDEYREGEE